MGELCIPMTSSRLEFDTVLIRVDFLTAKVHGTFVLYGENQSKERCLSNVFWRRPGLVRSDSNRREACRHEMIASDAKSPTCSGHKDWAGSAIGSSSQ